jgi:hypothetical protein
MKNELMKEMIRLVIQDAIKTQHNKLSYENSFELNQAVSDAVHTMGYEILVRFAELSEISVAEVAKWVYVKQYEEIQNSNKKLEESK